MIRIKLSMDNYRRNKYDPVQNVKLKPAILKERKPSQQSFVGCYRIINKILFEVVINGSFVRPAGGKYPLNFFLGF